MVVAKGRNIPALALREREMVKRPTFTKRKRPFPK